MQQHWEAAKGVGVLCKCCGQSRAPAGRQPVYFAPSLARHSYDPLTRPLRTLKGRLWEELRGDGSRRPL